MTSANKMEVSLPSDTEIVLTRFFNAPRTLVWEVHTKPEHVRQWWGTRDTVLTTCDIDLRPGGAWRYVFNAGDGQEYGFSGTFSEITPPERLVYTEIFDPFPDNAGVNTLVLEEVDGRTKLTSTSVYESKQVRDMVIETGMEGGAAESYDRLEELLEKLS